MIPPFGHFRKTPKKDEKEIVRIVPEPDKLDEYFEKDDRRTRRYHIEMTDGSKLKIGDFE